MRTGVLSIVAVALASLPCLGGWVLDGTPQVAGGGPVAVDVQVTQGTYPVFHLDLGLTAGNWTDFEIKATTNNFTSLVYYHKSWTPHLAAGSDTNTLTYFTDDDAADVRAWRLQSNGVPISAHLANTNSVVQWVYFYPSHDGVVDWRGWMSATNASLVWSFARVDNLGIEMNAEGTKQRWNPIRPDSWDAERTRP